MKAHPIRRVLRDNGLSLTLLVLFVLCLCGQVLSGHRAFNAEQREHGRAAASLAQYLAGSHFAEATAENWESEFLQMAAYVWLTAFLFQRGSAESNDPDGRERGRPPPPRSRVPWAARQKGLVRKVYEHSLSLAFALLFLVSISIHALAGAARYSAAEIAHGGQPVTTWAYVRTSQFWFESFQNWQSEFLAILSMIACRSSSERRTLRNPRRSIAHIRKRARSHRRHMCCFKRSATGRDAMKATDFLKKQHREVMKLFKQVEKTEAPGERKRLMSDIVAHLKVHTTIEEEIFYPAVKEIGTEKAEEMILEAVEEHHVVDLVIEELPRVDPGADTFEAKMTVLRELIEHHVEEEQDEVFPMAEKKLGSERISELGDQLAQRAGALEAKAA